MRATGPRSFQFTQVVTERTKFPFICRPWNGTSQVCGTRHQTIIVSLRTRICSWILDRCADKTCTAWDVPQHNVCILWCRVRSCGGRHSSMTCALRQPSQYQQVVCLWPHIPLRGACGRLPLGERSKQRADETIVQTEAQLARSRLCRNCGKGYSLSTAASGGAWKNSSFRYTACYGSKLKP